MACTWSSKVNGILTVVTIGVAVLIDLWDILDIKKGHSMVSSSRERAYVKIDIVAGILLEAFHGSSRCFDRLASHPIPFLLLDTSYYPRELWTWGQFHESSVPGDPQKQ